ncbi:MAG: helix-turn-helix domain-containing protein [Candidatus Nanohaloarchaea archaeon]|nr:helix-turn-helix domain-containing protein [Candidatus Nanohaloarchaea archaeon]
MINPVSEPIINEVLPALRSFVAQELDSRGYSQDEIAELLEVTQPAVSQYLNEQRGAAFDAIREDDELHTKADTITSYIAQRKREQVQDAYKDFITALIYRPDFEDIVDYDKQYFMDI